MIRKKMLLADEDEQYLKEIRHEFMEKAPQFELITFTKRENVYHYLEQGGVADIVVLDEGLVDETFSMLPKSVTKIALSSSMISVDGYEIVKKYQKMEVLLSDILLKYAQDSGVLEVIRGDSDTRIAAFYSPAGGSGKTALALALAVAGAQSGLRTLYLNLEEIDSVKNILNPTPGCLSDIFLALKTRGMQVGIKLKESVGTESASGFSYVSGVESISEYEEIDGEDIKKLLGAIRELSSYDLVVLDQSSGFTGKTISVLEASDVIFMPVVEEDGSIFKTQRFLEESGLHREYDSLFNKTNMIINKLCHGSAGRQEIPDSIKSQLSCCAGIALSPVFAKLGGILRAGDRLSPLMNPVLEVVMAERSKISR